MSCALRVRPLVAFNIEHSTFRFPDGEQVPIYGIELDDYGVAQPRVRNEIAEDNPPTALSRHVNRFVSGSMEDGQCADGCIVAQDAAGAAGGVFAVAHGE